MGYRRERLRAAERWPKRLAKIQQEVNESRRAKQEQGKHPTAALKPKPGVYGLDGVWSWKCETCRAIPPGTLRSKAAGASTTSRIAVRPIPSHRSDRDDLRRRRRDYYH